MSKLANMLFSELGQTDAAKLLKQFRSMDFALKKSMWKVVTEDVKSILNGQWQIESATPEFAAAWMFIYLISEILETENKVDDSPIGLSDSCKFITLDFSGDVYLYFDFVKAIRREMRIMEDYDDQQGLSVINNMRKRLDEIEKDVTKEFALESA